MRKNTKDIIKVLDYIKLLLASIALFIVIGGLIYKSKGEIYPIDVNIVVSFMLSFYVMLTGLEIYIREKYKNIGLFLILCSIMILILNIIAVTF